MDRKGRNLPTGKEELLADVADFDPGGGRSKGAGSLLKGGSLGGVPVQDGDVVLETHDGAGPEYVSPQGCATAHCDIPRLAAEMAEAGFEDIGIYFTRKQNTVSQYIVTLSIMYLCDWSTWKQGVWVSQSWWEKDGFDLESAKERVDTELYR